MHIFRFAHEGVEHSTPAEAAAHEDPSNAPMILAISIVAVVILWIIYRLLTRKSPKKTDKKSEPKETEE